MHPDSLGMISDDFGKNCFVVFFSKNLRKIVISNENSRFFAESHDFSCKVKNFHAKSRFFMQSQDFSCKVIYFKCEAFIYKCEAFILNVKHFL